MKDWQKVAVPRQILKMARDKGITEPRVLVEVCVESASGKVMCGQWVPCTIKRESNEPGARYVRTDVVREGGEYISGGDFEHTPHKMLVFVSELGGLLAMVRSERHWEDLRSCRRQFEKLTADQMKGLRKPEEREKHLASLGMSVESLLYDRGYRTGIPSVVSVKVIDENVPPLDIPEARAAQSQDTIAETLAALKDTLQMLIKQQGGGQQQHKQR